MAPASNVLAEFQRVRGRALSGYSSPSAEDALADDDVIGGLRRRPKRLPWRMLYDDVGAALFEQITGLDDYYPARNELRLLDAHLGAIAAELVPPRASSSRGHAEASGPSDCSARSIGRRATAVPRTSRGHR